MSEDTSTHRRSQAPGASEPIPCLDACVGTSDTRAVALGRWLCVAGAVLGGLALVGWIAGVTFLTSIVPGLPPMQPNTSVGLLLVGTAGALRYRQDAGRVRKAASIVASVLVLIIGAGTLVQYLFGTDLGIDELVIRSGEGQYPGRMSPLTALAFTFLGAAIIILDVRPTARARPSEWLILLAGLLGLVALTGMLLGATPLYQSSRRSVVGVAVPTGVGIVLVSLGLLLVRSNAGFMRVATSHGPGGILLRRLAIPTIVSPPLLAFLLTKLGTALGLGHISPLPIAVLVVVLAVTGFVLLAVTAAPLNQADAALRASEAKFSGIISIAPDAIISIDSDQRITIFNEGAQEIFGWAPEEAIGEPLDILIPERLREIHRQHVRDFAAEPDRAKTVGHRRPIVGLRKDGQEFPAEAAISKLPLHGAHVFTVVLRDVTERVRTEWEQRFLARFSASLAASLDFDEAVASVARMCVHELADCCIVDLAGEGDATERRLVAHADPAWIAACHALQTIGAARPSIVQRVLESGQPLKADVGEGFLESICRTPEQLEAFRKLDPRSIMVVPMSTPHGTLGALALFSTQPSRRYDHRDLQFAVELARRASMAVEKAWLYETAQRAVRMRDEVLGIVAHDLRNPLSTIVIQSQLLEGCGPEPERRTQRPGERIHRAALRMERLIQDLLDVSRMESGLLTVQQERVQTVQAVADAAETQRSIAAAASLELRVDISRDIPDVLADRDRLQQVFENLIGNAIKFTDPGGSIVVGASHRDGTVLFWVADTGHGIAPDDVPCVFDRFWQLRKGERRGAGLGLPIAKGLVEAHGGRIWVESAVGRGSTFFFTIPAAPRVDQWQPAAAHGP